MVTYSLDFREGELILALLAAAFAVSYWAWKEAAKARSGAWAVYDEIHSNRTQAEENPHSNQFEWAEENGSDE